MSNPKISIISPVYNVEKYIRRCVDSIIAQTFTDWELILVDDGSLDTSGTICDQYASQDSRIRVIHKQNGGVSAARQTGLDASQGEYVIHVDPDDWVEPTMLEELYAKVKAEDADMVICDYYTNSGDKQVLNIQCPTDVSDNVQIIRDLFQKLHGSCWNKLVRRGCFRLYDISFPKSLNYCEDQLTIVRLLLRPIKVAYLNNAFYHYFDNPNSITRNYQRQQYDTRRYYADLLEQYLPSSINKIIIRKVRFDIFVEAVIYNVLTREEIDSGLSNYKKDIKTLGLRWRLGFLFLGIGMTFLAYKLLKF